MSTKYTFQYFHKKKNVHLTNYTLELDFSRNLWFKFSFRCIKVCIKRTPRLEVLSAEVEWKKLLSSYQFIKPVVTV
jgi:hypothetical protein